MISTVGELAEVFVVKVLVGQQGGQLCDIFKVSREEDQAPNPTTWLLSNNQGVSVRHNSIMPKGDPDLDKPEYNAINIQPTTVASVDKIFEDRGKIYDQFLVNYFALKDCKADFQKLFSTPKETEMPIGQCVEKLGELCKQTTVNLCRTHKYCMTILFDANELRDKKGAITDTVIIPAITYFNTINKLLKCVQEQSPTLIDSLILIMKDEVTLRRNIMNADLGPSKEPQALKRCVENYSEIRKCQIHLKDLSAEVDKLFNTILNASQSFFE